MNNQTPSVEALQDELKRIRHRRKYSRVIRTTIYTLITVAAVAVLIAVLWLPVLQIQGNSMTPTIENGDIVVSFKTDNCDYGDIIAFYYNNKVLVKRVVAAPGDWVDIDASGNVSVNGVVLDEPYVTEKALGQCDIQLPYQVPAAKYFVLGDHRSVSVDSRNSTLGCVAEDQIVGKILFRVWPLNKFGTVN